MSVEQECKNRSGHCLLDLFRMETSSNWDCRPADVQNNSSASPRQRLQYFLHEPGNQICADCGSPDPKWVSLSVGALVCIKCSGVHRSLGVHITKVLSVKLDEWTDEQVDSLINLGGNTLVNSKYEAVLPENFKKPNPDSSIQERSDFIRGKYELQQFLETEEHLFCPFPPASTTSNLRSSSCCSTLQEKKQSEKQTAGNRISGLGNAFRNSWRRKESKDSEHKSTRKCKSMAGMVEFIGLIKVNVVKGTNLAVRDMVSSDPYVVLSLGKQSVKTRAIKNNLNPVWNEQLMLSIPDDMPPLKVNVYDKDMFSTDDYMGEAEIDIEPLVTAARASENSTNTESMQLGKWKASKENTLIEDGIISVENGVVKQDIALKLQNVERGVLEIELECVPLTQ